VWCLSVRPYDVDEAIASFSPVRRSRRRTGENEAIDRSIERTIDRCDAMGFNSIQFDRSHVDDEDDDEDDEDDDDDGDDANAFDDGNRARSRERSTSIAHESPPFARRA